MLAVEQKVKTETSAKVDPSARKEVRIPELDGIRGIAVLLVLALHGFAWSMQEDTWKGFPRVIELLTRPGGLGVDLFFVLSGFLITGILLDSAGKPHYFRNFYGRRALRILPLYYLMLLLIFLFYPRSGNFVLLGLFYISNMTGIFGVPNVYGPLWSLSVEEHFYLLWPWAVSTLGLRRIALVTIGIIIAVPIVRAVSFWHGWDVFPYSWCRFDGIASGAFLATFVRSPGHTRSRLLRLSLGCLAAGALLAGGGLPLGIYTRSRLFGATFLFTDVNLFFTGLVALVVSGSLPALTALMRLRPLRWCGDLSYCLYIIHFFIFDTWNWLFGKYPPGLVSSLGRFGTLCLRAGIVYLVCFLVAELSRRYFEGPILKMKRIFT
jgi:peptidoglycan/LPS O-acetylase OafA/YrhL